MKYFITGVAGFLGSHLAERLIADGHSVVGVDNLIGGEERFVPKGVKLVKVDCQQRDFMAQLMKGCDIVYHCACTPHEGLSVFSPYFITDNTFSASVSVISAAIENNVKRFVLCSSAARYGALQTPFTEDMIPQPEDPYGIAKYATELTLKKLSEIHGMEYSIVVPHNIIGTRQKYDDPYRNVVSIFINLMLQGKSPIIYGDGKQERSFSFVDDVVEPMIKMGTLSEAVGQVINVGPDDMTITINDLALRLAKIIGFTGNIIHVPDRPSEVKVVHCSSDKARRLLGYKPQKRLDEGLLEMVEWIEKEGVKPFTYHLPIEIYSKLLPLTWKEKLI